MPSGPPPRSFPSPECLNQPDLPQLAEFFEWWNGLRGERIGPRSGDIKPSSIRKHLPQVFMLDVVDGGAEFRYRLIGTEIVAGMGRDSTGKTISEVYGDHPDAMKRLIRSYEYVVKFRTPAFGHGKLFWHPEARFRNYSACLLPVSDDGETVNMIIGEVVIF